MVNPIGDKYADIPQSPEGTQAREQEARRAAIETADPDKGLRMRINETSYPKRPTGFPKTPRTWDNE